jgi:DNA-binding CsgD family transcriptional regulator
MRRRGRPPTPDILTPREWEVLDLIRAGLTNQAIADRLGISLSGAKHHVSEIISKLGVESREEAAAFDAQSAQRSRWIMLPQMASLSGLRAALAAASAPKLAFSLVVPLAVFGVAAASFGGILTLKSDASAPSVAVTRQSVPDSCATLLTYQCLESESQSFTTLQDAAAVASFQPSLPGYIPEGFQPVAIRHTRPEGTTEFVQSESFKLSCPGCDPRMSHNDQIGIYYRAATGRQLAVLQGFPATLLVYDQAPADRKGTVEVGDKTIYWLHGVLGSGEQITLYWDIGRVGTGWAKEPDGSVVYGSPMSYSITSNGLELEELLRMAESVSFK